MLFSLFALPTWTADTDFAFKAIPITEHIYSIVSPSFGLPTPENRGWNSNSHFVVTKTGVLLFDTGSSESIGKGIKKAIQSVTDLPVRWVINSHSHADHWFGNAAFSEAEIIASSAALETMKAHGPPSLAFYKRVTKGTIGETALVHPTVLLSENQKRTFGGVAVEFIFSNDGHSPGDLLMWLPEEKVMVGGDVLGSDWMPIVTGHGNVPGLIKTLEMVAALKPNIVLPGHGQATTGASVVRDAAFLSRIWQHVQTNHKQKTAEEILANIQSEMGPQYGTAYKDFNTDLERYVKLLIQLQA
nr:MBL fold metallo-hydrolase [Acanthopleuribacter pedis]